MKKMALNMLFDLPGAYQAKKRKGRGIGSGKGKTAGRGGKGQTARSGVAINGFEGGQMPLHMRMPKRGFKGKPKTYSTVNLDRILDAIDAKKLDPSRRIDEISLSQAGLIPPKSSAKLLARCYEFNVPVNLSVTHASNAAIDKVRSAGGNIFTTKLMTKADIESPSIFPMSMNYTISSQALPSGTQINLVFNLSSVAQYRGKIDDLNAFIDCPELELEDKIFHIGRDTTDSGDAILKYSLTSPKKMTSPVSLDLLVQFRNVPMYRKKVRLNRHAREYVL